jgi:hypothetical protein
MFLVLFTAIVVALVALERHSRPRHDDHRPPDWHKRNSR